MSKAAEKTEAELTREAKLEGVGAVKANPNASLLPKLEALKEEAKDLGAHAAIADHLDEAIFQIKRDMKQRELMDKAGRGR